jgi:putative transposase
VVFKSRIFPAKLTEENSDEERKIQRRADHGDPEASRGRRASFRTVPRTWNEQRQFYKWRAKFGGMDASLISEMKDMAEENRRLKRMYAEMSMRDTIF